MKHQIPSTNIQIMTQVPMTEIIKKSFGDWILFGIWDLVIGISHPVTAGACCFLSKGF
ncbi:MAG: hypothetical protein AB1502_15865 [Thermodesulfobacteriota bacterium]